AAAIPQSSSCTTEAMIAGTSHRRPTGRRTTGTPAGGGPTDGASSPRPGSFAAVTELPPGANRAHGPAQPRLTSPARQSIHRMPTEQMEDDPYNCPFVPDVDNGPIGAVHCGHSSGAA